MSQKVSYCINTFICGNTINPGHDSLYCADCGAKLLIGDRYRLVEILNRENSDPNKLVYRGIDVANGTQVALKIIDTPKEEARKYLRREYEFLRTATAPFTRVKEENFFEWKPDEEHDFFSVCVLALPWIEGQDSLQWIQENGPLSEEACIQWLNQILAFLEVISEMSTIHRDIKPENIIVCPDNTIKMIDFGTVKTIDEQYFAILDGRVLNEDGSIRTGTRLMTFGYTAPEQAIGRAVIQSDFYSLGKTAIFWMTGKTPGELIEHDIDNWADICEVSQTFERFINRLTAQKVAGRPLYVEAIQVYLGERYPLELEAERAEGKPSKNIFASYIFPGLFMLSVIGILIFGGSLFFLSQGRKSIASDDYKRALDELGWARTLNPFSTAVIRQQAYAHLWMNNTVEAKRKFEQVLKREPKDVGALYHLGILNERMDKIPLAIEFYQQALEAEPIQIESPMRLARIALRKQDHENAEKYLTLARKRAKEYPEKEQPTDKFLLNFYLGWLDFEKGNYQPAFSHLKTALLHEVDDNQHLSVRSGDVVCLLAETATILEKKDALSLWSECFMSPSATSIGTNIRLNRMDEFINDSIK